jgi:hypothetical protein
VRAFSQRKTLGHGRRWEPPVSAQKKNLILASFKMTPDCHQAAHFDVYFNPERGGDLIEIKCSECRRRYFEIKLPGDRDAK